MCDNELAKVFRKFSNEQPVQEMRYASMKEKRTSEELANLELQCYTFLKLAMIGIEQRIHLYSIFII